MLHADVDLSERAASLLGISAIILSVPLRPVPKIRGACQTWLT
jgi:hypothetical protein